MEDFILWGTLVNCFAVIAGTAVGLLVRRFVKTPEKAPDATLPENGKKPLGDRISDTVMKGLGLAVVLIGLSGALKTENVLVTVVSIALGALIGELLDLDGLLNRLGAFVEKKMKGKSGSIAEGFVNATLLFCVGAMTVNGAIESAVSRTHDIYYLKALLDGVSAIVFGSALGFGVMLSAASVFLTQGLLTFIAYLLAGAIPADIIAAVIAVGSLLIVAIGLNLLGITKIRVMNLLPAMFLPIALCPLFALL